jgi:hypothetical protein
LICYVWNIVQDQYLSQKKMFARTAGELERWGDLERCTVVFVGEEGQIKTGQNNDKTGKYHNGSPQHNKQHHKGTNPNEKRVDAFKVRSSGTVDAVQDENGGRSPHVAMVSICIFDDGPGVGSNPDHRSFPHGMRTCRRMLQIRWVIGLRMSKTYAAGPKRVLIEVSKAFHFKRHEL